MELFYRHLGKGKPLIILHGLFGSSDNWMTIARTLSGKYQLFIPDQRNHGKSFHSEEFDYQVMVADLMNFIKRLNIENPYIMGHSMGGKVGMQFAVRYPDYLDKLVVVDIAPRSYEVHHDVILEGLQKIPLGSLKSREEADQTLAVYVPQDWIRNFLLKNLARNPDETFRWKINLKVIIENIKNVVVGIDESFTFYKPALFIDGEKSTYIKKEDLPLINRIFPDNRVVTVKDAGHWVHAEKTQEFLDIVSRFLIE